MINNLEEKLKDIPFGRLALFTEDDNVRYLGSKNNYEIGSILIIKDVKYEVVKKIYKLIYSGMTESYIEECCALCLKTIK